MSRIGRKNMRWAAGDDFTFAKTPDDVLVAECESNRDFLSENERTLLDVARGSLSRGAALDPVVHAALCVVSIRLETQDRFTSHTTMKPNHRTGSMSTADERSLKDSVERRAHVNDVLAAGGLSRSQFSFLKSVWKKAKFAGVSDKQWAVVERIKAERAARTQPP